MSKMSLHAKGYCSHSALVRAGHTRGKEFVTRVGEVLA